VLGEAPVWLDYPQRCEDHNCGDHRADTREPSTRCGIRGPYTYETTRKWAETGVIEAKKERGRWFVNKASLNVRLARLAAA